MALFLAALVGVGFQFWESILWHLKPMDQRPSYVLIVMDDLDWDLVAQEWLAAGSETGEPVTGSPPTATKVRFPELRELAQAGMVFTNFHATTPVCGPARASILSGQYASRHRVRVNRPGHPTANGFAGGFRQYGRNRDFVRSMQAAHYQTCFVGKYVHDGFEPNPAEGIAWSDLLPYGWDRFHACMGAQYNNFWAVDSQTAMTQKIASVFRTDYETDQVIAMLAQQAQTKQAQMICWFTLLPHDSTETEVAYPDRCRELFVDEIPPSFARQVTAVGLELPEALRVLPSELSREQQTFIQEKWIERLRSVKAFDENLGRIRRYLQEQGRWENTVIFITSDHGFRLGDHGHVGKRLPYDPITRVPLLVCGGGVRPGRSEELLANIDLAPTLLELSQSDRLPDVEMDGRSFADLIRPASMSARPRRAEVLLEGWESENIWGQRVPGVWTALRTQREQYTEWASGEREYYELAEDPWQLKNRYAELSTDRRSDWETRLHQLRQTDRPPILSLPPEAWEFIAAAPQNPCFSAVTWQGYVDADGGIERLQMQVCDAENQVYWDGRSWGQTATDLPVHLQNPSGLVSGWEFQLQIPLGSTATDVATAAVPSEALAERTVTLTVSATGANGKVNRVVAAQSVRLRLLDPETWIESPAGAPPGQVPATLRGWAAGHVPLRFVRLVIRDTATQTYWNGETWVADFTQVNATLGEVGVDGRRSWEFEFQGQTNGPLYIAARAVDQNGNFDKTVAVLGKSDSAAARHD
jgi:arylsulfatase A-like enzyme